MKKLAGLILLLLSVNIHAQTLFTETFDEGNGSTSGTDETGGVSWTSNCSGCISGDLWEEFNGEFRNNDSNGPATWTSGIIDVSGCNGNVEICFDYNLTGAFEACGTGCNSVDWISLDYTVDGTPGVPGNSYYCDGACADLNVVWDGGLGGSGTYCSSPIDVNGNDDFEMEIGSQTWAGTEYIDLDNITLTCLVVLELDTTQNFPVVVQDTITPKTIQHTRDIHGRIVNYPLATGIYFQFYTDGTHKKLMVR